MPRLLLAAVAALGLLAACGDPGATTRQPQSDAPLPAEDRALHDMLPQRLKDSGVLKVGTTLPNLPYLLTDSNNNITGGITPEVGRAVAAKLGLRYEIENIAWEALLPGVTAGRFDMADDGLSDTEERQRVGLFVDYMRSASVLVTAKSNEGKYKSVEDSCGKRVATIRGTTDVQHAEEISQDCQKKGKGAVEVTQYPTAQDADLALRSGQADFQVAVTEQAKYAIKEQNAPIAIVSADFAPTYVGMYLRKDDKQLGDALLAALKALKADGSLDRIIGNYGLEPLPEPGLNLATSGR
ncbi:transporter substrate-binding domain-containing protein [Actinosynnema sp. NPDC047251]|uniref:ABC-type transporter, substrate-binding lipoprotein n=1 Tax=Saccharothrix espanaensis (strain ATCC 51144 / DSM 44229 / JCM 9112 / NBRC 15066 / NRRL 15764) TaxID=1179773 RepID=K0JXZ4_SACES|nr:transporter substrate-binding domain-containing protein [Saccharothrix espanaensis]CCH31011.1 ABC-type transporter, substrate-binding lipoprotein [Saccharothrix espanaensis DSM 44229]